MSIPAQAMAETITISAPEWCPYICPNEPAKPGLLVEYTQAIFQRAGYDITVDVYPWSRAIRYAEDGTRHALLGAAKHEAPSLIFPENEIGEQTFCFYTKADDEWTYSSPAAVIGKDIIYPQDALPEEIIPYKNRARFSEVTGSVTYIEQALGMLLSDRTEIVLSSYYWMTHFLESHDMQEKVKLSGCAASTKVYLAFSPADGKLEETKKYIKIFDREIEILKQEGFFESLLIKYNLTPRK